MKTTEHAPNPVRYARWREAVDPERPLEPFDPLVRFAWSLLAGVGGLAFCLFGSVPAYVLFWRMVGRDQGFRRVERLRDHPAPYLQVACRLSLVWDGLVYGQDEGLFAVIEDSIVYEGRRTSFSVPRHGIGPHPENGKFSFSFETPAGPCGAWIEAFDRHEMKEATQTWPCPSTGQAQTIVCPPFSPEAVTLRQVTTAVAVSRLTLVIGLTVAAVAGLAYAPELGAVLALGSAAVSALTYRHARRREFTLKRLHALSAEPR